MARKSTRREFIKQSAALGTAWWVGTNTAWSFEKSSAERLNVASIGVGGKGVTDVREMSKLGNIVALCDVDDKSLGKASLKYPKAKTYNDYREMLTELDKEIDAVTVTTPDHSHAAASIMAMKMGKHCFCQKPLTWSVYEARKMRETAAEMNVATEMGNQGTAEDGLREAVEIIRGGALGTVAEVHVWTNRPIWEQGMGRPKETPAVPSHVHWDLFLGPAPQRPYHASYHPFKWRAWLDFGTGALGDMACHTANMPVMALQLFDPVSVAVLETTGIVENETYPKHTVLEYEFGQRGDLPPVRMFWYDGGNKPPAELLQGEKLANSGCLVVGKEGSLYSPNDYGSRYVLLPREKYADYKKPEPTLPRSPGHYVEFANACKGGESAMSNFDYAGRLTETVVLGNVAIRAGEKIYWDAANMKVTNIPEANQYVHREYREGWSL